VLKSSVWRTDGFYGCLDDNSGSSVTVLRYGPFVIVNFCVRNSNWRNDQSGGEVWYESGNYWKLWNMRMLCF
jgi:uncharacterized protein YraI